MSAELIERILAARRPGDWHEVDAWAFYIETPTQLEYNRIRAACVSYRADDVEAVRRFNAADFGLQLVLCAVTKWRGVTAGDFPDVELADSERSVTVDFALPLLRAFLSNRAALVTKLFAAVEKRMETAIAADQADQENSNAS